jgi:hypothetical protein
VEKNHETQYQPIQRQPLRIARKRKHRRFRVLRRRRDRIVLTVRRQADIGADNLILNRNEGWDSDRHGGLMIRLHRSIRHSFVMARSDTAGHASLFFPTFSIGNGLLGAESATATASVPGFVVTLTMLPETKGERLEVIQFDQTCV